jgi:hypothetical protein
MEVWNDGIIDILDVKILAYEGKRRLSNILPPDGHWDG